MKRIGLLSDTHCFFDEKVKKFLEDVDEIWHAGDIGDTETFKTISDFKPLKAVYGNIDNSDLRHDLKEYELFDIEGVKVLMIHIGGYPGNYQKVAKELISFYKPNLFISGHSHILKVMFDKKKDLLHINPGAVGKNGFHKVRTAVRFEIDGTEIQKLEVWEAER